MKRAFVVLTFLVLALSGCGKAVFDNGPDVAFAEKVVSELQGHEFDELAKQLSPANLPADPSAHLAQLATFLPPGKPTSIEIAGWRVTSVASIRQSSRSAYVGLQYNFDGKWLLAECIWHSDGSGTILIDDIRLQPLPASLQTINRFTLAGKGVLFYAFLALMIFFPLFCVAVFILCLRTRQRLRNKILWAIATLIGVCQFDLNWTTGEIAFTLVHFDFLSAGFISSGLGPWHMSLALPLGAIFFLLWRWQREVPGKET